MPERQPEFVHRAARKRRVLRVLLAADIVALLTATFGATYLRFQRFGTPVDFQNFAAHIEYWQLSLVATALWMLMLAYERLYDLERLTWGSGELNRVIRALGMGVVAFILATYALRMPGISRGWTLFAFAIAVTLVVSGRLLIRLWLARLRRAGRMHRSTLIVGDNLESKRIIDHLLDSPEEGLTPVGCLTTTQAPESAQDMGWDLVPALGVAREVSSVVRTHQIDTVIISGSAFGHGAISRIISELRGIDVSAHVSSGLFEVLTSRVVMRDVAGIPLMTVRGVALSRGALRTKRVFDVAISAAGIVIGLPVWVPIILAIKIDSRGPILYAQKRVGKGGAPFRMYKFRSMCIDADERLKELQKRNEASGPLFKMKNDPRVTRMGRWMRKYSIDEFPQLINVIRGEMSLVGPRPPLSAETEQYDAEHWRRLEVPPGMTGLWQVSGRSALSFEEMVRLDLFYIENWSVGFDVSLLMRTIPAVVFSRGAY